MFADIDSPRVPARNELVNNSNQGVMKPKHLVMIIGILLAVGGLWFGHAAWRAHRQLVTLDLRDVSLAEVLRKIEEQTWTKIRAEKSVNARITLHVKDAPLRSVLDRIAEQAGARWSTVYAVYDSSRALKALDSALRGDGKLESAGWTRLAPKLSGPDEVPESVGPLPPSRSDFRADSPPLTERKLKPYMRWRAGGPLPDASGPVHDRPRVISRAAEELVAETSLSARINSNGATRDLAATPDSAARAARAVGGKWTIYFAFRGSNLGIGLPTPREPFADLTPEQRVQLARQHLLRR